MSEILYVVVAAVFYGISYYVHAKGRGLTTRLTNPDTSHGVAGVLGYLAGRLIHGWGSAPADSPAPAGDKTAAAK